MATFTVTTANDVVDAGDGLTSLREAVTLANAATDADNIVFDTGLAGSTLVLSGGELLLTSSVTIDGDVDGDNQADITISGNNASRVFRVSGTCDVFLESLTITEGFSGSNGGAIRAGNAGVLSIVNSTISNSQATISGGGILAGSGSGAAVQFYLINSTVSNNQAVGNGGTSLGNSGGLNIGPYAVSGTIINSTIYGNTAATVGGGVLTNHDLFIYNSTIFGNHAEGAYGGGIGSFGSGQIFLTNSVIAGNTQGVGSVGDDISGPVTTATNSFIGTLETIINDLGGNINGGGDPLLAALADNGGTVQTLAIQSGSQLISAGNAALLPADTHDIDDDGNVVEALPLDANGGNRVQSSLDIGAVETLDNLVVDTLADIDDGDFIAGNLSLREALGLVVDGGTITFANDLAGGVIALNGTELVLDKSVIIDGDIDGDNEADIFISGFNASGSSRIFHLTADNIDVTLKSLQLGDGGPTTGNGGAILTDNGTSGSTLIIQDTMITENSAARGGAIFNRHTTLVLTNVAILDNSSDQFGGGVFLSLADATITNTTIDSNTADSDGGGIFVFQSELTLTNSTVTDNYADADGASMTAGGGIDIYDAVSNVTINNSVISQNLSGTTAYASDVSGIIDVANNNFFGQTVSTAGGPIIGMGDPLLAGINDNGGTVFSRLPTAPSALINAGDDALVPAGILTDVNGHDRFSGTATDIGAAEYVIEVTTADDEAAGATLAADIADGTGLSLREAIAHAGVGDSIIFDPNLAGSTLTLTLGELTLTQDVIIDGDTNNDNKADITISGNNASRIFNVSGAATNVDLLSLTVQDGNAVDRGGAIYAKNISTLDIVESTIANSSSGNSAGGIYVGGTDLTLNTVLLSGNSAVFHGGGAYLGSASTVDVINTTVYGNTADGQGGGIHLGSTSTLMLNNSTVSGNLADADGNNTTRGGGLNLLGTNNIDNTVVAGNTSGGGLATPGDNDVKGTISTASYSFFGTIATISAGASNINGGGDPLLGELLDNGGTVLTMSPLDGSALIDAGTDVILPGDPFDLDRDGNIGELLPLDGRGGLRIVGGAVDIGAVEQIVDEVIGATDGDNNIVGGLGNDTATYEDASAGVTTYLLFTGLDTGGSGVDTLSGIENLTGSAFDDRLVGDGNDNVLRGGDGVDILKGKGGNDVFYGGAGDDRLTGDAGDDIMFGGAGADILFALAGFDELNGGSGNDFIYGGRDEDVLNGDQGDDEVRGNRGIDVLNGGTGNDDLRGGGQDDILNGDEGDDFLFGENHMDVLFGGAGNDSLTGGFGVGDLDGDTDTFVYKDTTNGGGGFDRIKDFENGIDVMDLTSFGFANFAAVQALASDTGSGLRIDFGGGDVLFVENFLLADFDAGDVLV